MRTEDLFVVQQHDEHYTSYIVDDMLFHSEAEAEKFSSKYLLGNNFCDI